MSRMRLRPFLAVIAVFATLLGFVGAASARVDIRVDLASQRMHVRTADGEAYNWAISSGREGFRTIRGNFQPTRLEKRWHSRKYGGAMPNAIFFRGGFAIHGTGDIARLGRPASHGCVRLHPANAAKLFALVQKHGKGATRIAVNGIAPDSNSQFAKAKPRTDKAMIAKARSKPTDWATAKSRMLERDGQFEPTAAMGFRPMNRASGNWNLRR